MLEKELVKEEIEAQKQQAKKRKKKLLLYIQEKLTRLRDIYSCNTYIKTF
jgi:hypothetical protein